MTTIKQPPNTTSHKIAKVSTIREKFRKLAEQRRKAIRSARGFTLTEMAVVTAVMLMFAPIIVSIVSVAMDTRKVATDLSVLQDEASIVRSALSSDLQQAITPAGESATAGMRKASYGEDGVLYFFSLPEKCVVWRFVYEDKSGIGSNTKRAGEINRWEGTSGMTVPTTLNDAQWGGTDGRTVALTSGEALDRQITYDAVSGVFSYDFMVSSTGVSTVDAENLASISTDNEARRVSGEVGKQLFGAVSPPVGCGA